MVSNQELVDESSNINLPGWKNITDKKHSLYIRSIWILAVTFSVAVCAIQIIERINHFSKSTVNFALRLDFNAPLKFPNFAICPNKSFDEDSRKMDLERQLGRNITEPIDVCDFLQLGDLPRLDDLWETTEISNNNVSFVLYNTFTMTKNMFEIESFKTVSGTCKLLKYNASFEITPNTKLRMELNTKTKNQPGYHYSISIHDNSIMNHYSLLDGAQMIWSSARFVSFTVQKYHALNTTENTCASSDEFHSCRRRCLNNKLNKNVQCRLPFMDDYTKPYCPTVNQCKHALKTTKEIMTAFNWTNCLCVKECHSTKYKMTEEFLRHGQNWLALYESNFKAFPVETVEEFQSYTIVALVCDIGGILSLCLGFCLLTALEVLDAFVFTNKSANTFKINQIQAKELTKKPISFASNVWTTRTVYNK